MADEIDVEDMIIVIVEEEPAIDNNLRIKQEPIDIKTECVEKVLNDAMTHGQFIKIKQERDDNIINDIKTEKENKNETSKIEECRQNRAKTKQIDNAGSDFDSSSNESSRKMKTRTNKRAKIKRKGYNSYIQKLRNENPEFVESPSKLVDHLVDMMKTVSSPPDPKDFCTEIKDEEKKAYKCNICKYQCTLYVEAVRHYRRFHGPRYLMCYACGMDFSITDNLYKHEKKCRSADVALVLQARGRFLGVKGRSRPYTTDTKFLRYDKPRKRHYCSQCSSSFALRANLVAHELMHKGLRPFRCHLCPAAYTADYTLKRHLETHTDARYTCDHCGFTTKLRSSLHTHMGKHLPERRFGCEYCERRYAHKTALRLHVHKQHHRLPPEHACAVCRKRFVKIYNLKIHMKNMHGLKLITPKMMVQSLPTLSDMTVTAVKVLKSDSEEEVPKQESPSREAEKSNIQAKSDINGSKKRELEAITLPNNDPTAVHKFLEIIHDEAKPGCTVEAKETIGEVKRLKQNEKAQTVALSVKM